MLDDTYDVQKAVGGAAALEQASAAIDVLVIDRNMPTVSGEEVLRRLRDSGITCGVVMLTAVEPEVDIVDLDVDDYLTKPVTEAELKSSISEVLEIKEYDPQLRDYFSLSNKRDVLLEAQADLPGTEEFEAIEEQLIATADRNLQKSEEALETLIQSSPAAIVTLDRDGMVDVWNKRAEVIFGWSGSAVIGSVPPMFSAESADVMETVRERLFRGKSVNDLIVECTTKSRGRVTVSLSAAPLYDREREMDGMMFVMEDITERKQRQQRLSVLDRILRHNLRNELNVVIGQLSVLQETLSPTEQEHVDTAVTHVKRILAQTEKARAFQSILSASQESFQIHDLEGIIERIHTKSRATAGDVTFDTEIQTSRTEARTSPGVEDAVWQLVENALEHSGQSKPHVQLTVDRHEGGDQEWVRLTVADNGPGIPDEELRVLDKDTETPLEHGSGIGLWIVKWVVDHSGGELSFTQSDLGGTRVTILLPPADSRPRDA